MTQYPRKLSSQAIYSLVSVGVRDTTRNSCRNRAENTTLQSSPWSRQAYCRFPPFSQGWCHVFWPCTKKWSLVTEFSMVKHVHDLKVFVSQNANRDDGSDQISGAKSNGLEPHSLPWGHSVMCILLLPLWGTRLTRLLEPTQRKHRHNLCEAAGRLF
jgi:hypothetical protein